MEELSRERDAAWERAARLTVLANDMAADLERLREMAAQLTPQTYESLGERARLILTAAEEEAAELRTAAEAAAWEMREAAEAGARAVREAADNESAALRTEAEAWAEHTLETARATAEETWNAARADAEQWQEGVAERLRQAREEALAADAERKQDQGSRWESEVRELAEQKTQSQAALAERETNANRQLAEAQQAYAWAEDAARQMAEDGTARASEIVSSGRARAERVERETERVLREHAEQRDVLTAHLEQVRNGLTALTGRSLGEPGPTGAHQAEQPAAGTPAPDDARDVPPTRSEEVAAGDDREERTDAGVATATDGAGADDAPDVAGEGTAESCAGSGAVPDLAAGTQN